MTDLRERFDEHDGDVRPLPECYGTAESFDCTARHCPAKKTCYIAWTNRRASERARKKGRL